MIARTNRRLIPALSVSLLLVTALAACGDNDGGSDADSAKGDIKLVQIVPVDSPILTLPGLRDGAKVAVAAINAAGGVNGRKLDLTFCDDKNDPTTAATCAQDAVADGAVARVSSSGTQGAQILPILEAAGMADFGTSPVVPVDSQSKVAFPLNLGPYIWQAEGDLARQKFPDAKTAVIVTSDLPANEDRIALVKTGAEAAGFDVLDTVTIPANSPDVSPVLAKVKQAAPDVVLGIISAPDQVKYWNASAAAGVDQIPEFTTSTGMTPDILKSGGSTIGNTFYIDTYPSPTGDEAGASDYRSDVEKYGAGTDVSSDSFKGWIGVQVLAQIMKGIDGDVTRESVLDALNTTSGLDALYFHGLDFTKPGPFEDSPRITVTNAYLFVSDKDTLTDAGISTTVK